MHRRVAALLLSVLSLGCSTLGMSMDESEPSAQAEPAKQKITLPTAIEMCVSNNFRVLAGAERMRMAEADLTTSSLIPNASLFADYQLIPLQRADIENQLGPPQWDALVTVPID
jgi:hypothetical protein